MNCLCCGQKLDPHESRRGWHARCVRAFFGVENLPEFELSAAALQRLGRQAVTKGLSVAGVQKKLSLHLSAEQPGSPARLTLLDYPGGYILKPEVEDYPSLPQAEHFVMSLAESCGIQTAPHALLKKQGRYAFITKRVDRLQKGKQVELLAMEDFCQLEERLTEDKYKSSYERCAKLIQRWSAQPGLDLGEFFLRLIFCFLTGNSDMHLKNFSLLEERPASATYRLSPAYDLLPTNLFLPDDPDELALTLRGKRSRLQRKHFLEFAEQTGLERLSAERLIDRLLEQSAAFPAACADSLMSAELKEGFNLLLERRRQALAC